jgi:hypothetical protein
MNVTYQAPLLISEASALWSDFVLMKRAAEHRPPAAFFAEPALPTTRT